jgi:four helix bundle protein
MHALNDLQVWVKSRKLAKDVYLLTGKLPKEEKFGLTSQMRRAAVSIASNIAEGAGRNSDKEFVQFLAIAYGSTYELKTQLFICVDLNYVDEKSANELITGLEEIEKMIWGLQQSIQKRFHP